MLIAVGCSNSEEYLFTEYVNFTDDGENITFFLCQDIGDYIDDVSMHLFFIKNRNNHIFYSIALANRSVS